MCAHGPRAAKDVQVDAMHLLTAVEQIANLMSSGAKSSREMLADFSCVVNTLVGRARPRAVSMILRCLGCYGQGYVIEKKCALRV